jgi:hypothetical protein
MYIYKLNDDGSCAVQSHRPRVAIPDGWTQVPPGLDIYSLYMVDGELTDQRLQAEVDKEALEIEYEEKIQAKIREAAVTTLKANGDLPVDFKDENIERGR